jgi:hypothetical protein
MPNIEVRIVVAGVSPANSFVGPRPTRPPLQKTELDCFRALVSLRVFFILLTCSTLNSQLSTIVMADTYVPLIRSGTAGPLGVLHLPRLWQKVSLESQGKLAAGYPGIGRGYDAMTCAALGSKNKR